MGKEELTSERRGVSFAVTAHERLHACNIAESCVQL